MTVPINNVLSFTRRFKTVVFIKKGTDCERAFSLCEVAMALGLFVFALTGLLGIMSVALNSIRESSDISTTTQVADGLAASLSRAEALPEEPLSTFYFDDVGKMVLNPGEAVYRAVVRINDSENIHLKRTKISVFRGSSQAFSKDYCYIIFKPGA